MQDRQIPIYLFNGFLESGKTKFIQETLQDERFGKTDRTLVLCCEQGEIEYEPEKFALDNYKVEYVDNESDFTLSRLEKLDKDFKPDCVMLEYNGMWSNDTLFNALPESWAIAQVMTFFDTNTFLMYNQNMRQQTFEKIAISDLVVFNRFNFELDKMPYHKAVRGVTRRCDILYESADGVVERDEIVDPLPYDINAQVIEIEDKDYAYFYRDISEEMGKYNGKTISFLGQVGKSDKMDKNDYLIGRHIMTCCEADIEYSPLVAITTTLLKHKDFVKIKAKVVIETHKIYKGKGPVLKVISVEKALAPQEKIVTFY